MRIGDYALAEGRRSQERPPSGKTDQRAACPDIASRQWYQLSDKLTTRQLAFISLVGE